jgi:radical SAM protein with 4Fe4S-binding SPASM domain
MSPICELTTGMSDREYWCGFTAKVDIQRVPFSGSLALTHRCNLGCVHCYAKEEPLQHDISSAELSSGQWKKIISEIKEAGCLYLLLTGGEPLLREDFCEIYSFAKLHGFLVTVFTNGTLVTDRIVELFGKLPPHLVEISLYGANAETHDRVTAIPGSFARALNGIETLIDMGVRVGLKSMLMTLNAEEFSAIEKLAQGYGVNFRLDPALFPALAGARSPLDLRVTPEQAVSQEFSDPDRAREWREFFDRYRGVQIGNKLYACGAGTTTFHIDSHGYLYPCLMASKRKYSLLAGSFQTVWDGDISRIREDEAGADFKCHGCEKRLLCGYCPGFFELENGQDQIPSDYLCAIGKLRFEKISVEAYGG